ncbi:DUF6160 family protein [Pseudomonas sp. HK3]
MTFKIFTFLFVFLSFSAQALEEISDESLANVSGQSGVSLFW